MLIALIIIVSLFVTLYLIHELIPELIENHIGWDQAETARLVASLLTALTVLTVMVIVAPVFTLVATPILIGLAWVAWKLEGRYLLIKRGFVCECGYTLYKTRQCSECGKVYTPESEKEKPIMWTEWQEMAKPFTLEEVREYRRKHPSCTARTVQFNDMGKRYLVLQREDGKYIEI